MSEIAGKREAQQRADRLRILRHELARLEGEGVLALSEEQGRVLSEHIDSTLATLAARFDIDTTESQKQFSWGMRIASTIGGLALCAAVFLFFYRFWGLLATPVQVGVLALAPLAAVAAAEFAARRERTLYFASLLGLVAIASFVLNLTVLGSIFNITPSPGAFLAWGLFALALAYHHRLRLPLLAGLLGLLIYVAATLTAWWGFWWPSFMEGSESMLLAGLLVLAVPLSARHRRLEEFLPVYRLVGLLAVYLPMLALSLKAGTSYLPIPEKNLAAFYQVAGMASAAAAIWVGIRRRFTGVVNLSAAFFVTFLYCRFVAWWWDWMPKYLFFLIIGLISVGLLALFRRLRAR